MVKVGVIEYTKSVYTRGFQIGKKKPLTMEDTCQGHVWKHRKSKYFRNPLPKNWVYCFKCGTEKLEIL